MSATTGLLVTILHPPNITQNNLLARFNRAVLLGKPGGVKPDEDIPALQIVVRERQGGHPYYHVEPVAPGTYAFGGSFVHTSDSRFAFDYPLPLHDYCLSAERSGKCVNPEWMQAVRLCARMDHYSLWHQVRLLPEAATAFHKHCDPCRAVEASRIIERVADMVKPPPNSHALTFRVGKEYSRVLYVEIVHAYWTEPHRNEVLTRELDALASFFEADEHSAVESNDAAFTYRFWWD